MPFSFKDLFRRRSNKSATEAADAETTEKKTSGEAAKSQEPNATVAAAETTGTVSAAHLNVRDAARTGKVLGTVKQGDSVEIVSEKDGWYEIDFNGAKGFVSAAFVFKGGGGSGGGGGAAPAVGGHRPANHLKGVYDKHKERGPKTERNDTNKGEHTAFSAHWKKHKARYEAVANKVDIPARLIAALHWRESSGSFKTYLHQGDPLGKKAVNHPSNIPVFHKWEDAAVHALRMRDKLSNQRNLKIGKDTTDMAALLTYAEAYNGLGYHKYHKDVASPYIYAGTNQYSKGKYESDGKYSSTMRDKQAGAYGMIEDAQG